MNDKTDKLSALMDGELPDQQDQNKCFEQLAKDKEMQNVWQRYHLARDAMKGQLSAFPSLDISAAVSESLKAEAVIFTPMWRKPTLRFETSGRFSCCCSGWYDCGTECSANTISLIG